MLVRDKVLNSNPIRPLILRRISIENLMAQISGIKTNYLVVGDHRCWLVSAANSHKNYYTGSECTVHLKHSINREKSWSVIEMLIKRFASPDSTIKVFYLHTQDDTLTPIAVV